MSFLGDAHTQSAQWQWKPVMRKVQTANSQAWAAFGLGHSHELTHCRLHSWLWVGKLGHREAVLFSGHDNVSHLESG